MSAKVKCDKTVRLDIIKKRVEVKAKRTKRSRRAWYKRWAALREIDQKRWQLFGEHHDKTIEYAGRPDYDVAQLPAYERD